MTFWLIASSHGFHRRGVGGERKRVGACRLADSRRPTDTGPAEACRIYRSQYAKQVLRTESARCLVSLDPFTGLLAWASAIPERLKPHIENDRKRACPAKIVLSKPPT
jgi:hypothetical protein